MITQSPFRIVDVVHLADRADEASLHRLIATYETQSDYGIAGRPYEPTGTTDVLIATFDHPPSEAEIAAALAPVRERPDDELLRLRYRYLRSECVAGDAMSQAEQRAVTEMLRDQDIHRTFDLPHANPEHDNVVYPARWAPCSYATALTRAAARIAPVETGGRS